MAKLNILYSDGHAFELTNSLVSHINEISCKANRFRPLPNIALNDDQHRVDVWDGTIVMILSNTKITFENQHSNSAVPDLFCIPRCDYDYD